MWRVGIKSLCKCLKNGIAAIPKVSFFSCHHFVLQIPETNDSVNGGEKTECLASEGDSDAG